MTRHSRTVWSLLAVARVLPSGLNATLATMLLWPVKLRAFDMRGPAGAVLFGGLSPEGVAVGWGRRPDGPGSGG
ncbi:hypothetical protein AB0M79_34465 [Polymorphospora sp. NPDC051019]|uniref:hypothetical protein n=1 Tax=Polymorphospora sp. NPDC051019 TaxID=3155725 RepID=UPI00342689CA